MFRLPTAIALGLTALLPAPAQTPPTQAPSAQSPSQARETRSAYVQGTLNLAAGERAVMKQQPDGSFALEGVQFVGTDAALPPVQGTTTRLEDIFTASPGTIALSLGARRGEASYLKVENGLDRMLDYTGFIVRFRDGRAQAPTRTSICTVMAGKLGFERWPEPVIQVVLADFKTVDGTTPDCESHDINE